LADNLPRGSGERLLHKRFCAASKASFTPGFLGR
jgi:hypothetical protein